MNTLLEINATFLKVKARDKYRYVSDLEGEFNLMFMSPCIVIIV